jgi:hypothetical protein
MRKRRTSLEVRLSVPTGHRGGERVADHSAAVGVDLPRVWPYGMRWEEACEWWEGIKGTNSVCGSGKRGVRRLNQAGGGKRVQGKSGEDCARPCAPRLIILERGDKAGLRAVLVSRKPGESIVLRWVEHLEAQAAGPSPVAAKLPPVYATRCAAGSNFRTETAATRSLGARAAIHVEATQNV